MVREFPGAAGLWLIEVDLPEFAVRGAVVLGRERALVWDTLSNPRDMAPVRDLAGGRDVVVVYSHADWDHVFGTAGLDPGPRSVVAHEACADRFTADVPRALAERIAADPAGGWDEVRLVPPDRTFRDRLDLDLGGVTVELHHLPGHTPDCLVAFLPESGVLLAGDTVEWPAPTVPRGAPVADWRAALAGWAGRSGLREVVPSHGPAGGLAGLRYTIDYLDALAGLRPFALPDRLEPFYEDAHRDNLRAFRPESS